MDSIIYYKLLFVVIFVSDLSIWFFFFFFFVFPGVSQIHPKPQVLQEAQSIPQQTAEESSFQVEDEGEVFQEEID